jgi:protein-S-isoprenylcysteine O-methyltransferase Ste14
MPDPSSIAFNRSPLFTACCVVALLAGALLQLVPPFPAIGVLGVGVFVLWVMRPATRIEAGLAAAVALLMFVQAAAGGGYTPDVSAFGAAPVWLLPFMKIPTPAWSPLAGACLVIVGCALLAGAMHTLRNAQRAGGLATLGPYARLRHPQGAALACVALGLFLPWPSLVACVLVITCIVLAVRAARGDEETLHLQFGLAYAEYANTVPAWVPRSFRDRHWSAPTDHGAEWR